MAKKNKYSYVAVSFIVLVFGIYAVPKIINAIKEDRVVKNNRSVDLDRNKSSLAQFKSIPDFSLVNQFKDTITRDDMYGKIWVIDFFFTSCPSICPEMTKNLKKLSEAFIDEPRFGILSISIDPERDTPERMRSYAAKYEVEHSYWYFLTGDKAEIMDLANKGFNLYAAENPDAPGGFEHSGKFALFDHKVMMRSRYDNFENPILFYDGVEDPHTPKEVQYDVEVLIEDVKQLLKEIDR